MFLVGQLCYLIVLVSFVAFVSRVSFCFAGVLYFRLVQVASYNGNGFVSFCLYRAPPLVALCVVKRVSLCCWFIPFRCFTYCDYLSLFRVVPLHLQFSIVVRMLCFVSYRAASLGGFQDLAMISLRFVCLVVSRSLSFVPFLHVVLFHLPRFIPVASFSVVSFGACRLSPLFLLISFRLCRVVASFVDLLLFRCMYAYVRGGTVFVLFISLRFVVYFNLRCVV